MIKKIKKLSDYSESALREKYGELEAQKIIESLRKTQNVLTNDLNISSETTSDVKHSNNTI